MRSRKFKNYGPVPRNEFTITDTSKINSDVDLGQAPQSDNVQNEQHIMKPRTHYGFGKLRSHGWLRSRSTNGWRAELASQQDQAADEEHIDSTPKD